MCSFRDQFLQTWTNSLQRHHSMKGPGSNKLRTYRLFKHVFELDKMQYATFRPTRSSTGVQCMACTGNLYTIHRDREAGKESDVRCGRLHKRRQSA